MVRRPAVADHRWMILNAASGRRGWDVGLARADCARQGLPEHRLPAAALASAQRRARHRVLPFLRRGQLLAPDVRAVRLGLLRPDPETRKNRYAAPLQATTEQLRGLLLTLIQLAENEVLRDEGEAYARELDDAGADVTNVRYNSTIHDFALLNALLDVPQHWHGHTARRHRPRLPPPLTSWLGGPLTSRRTTGATTEQIRIGHRGEIMTP